MGNRITDETGDWDVASRPHTTALGKTVRARVQRVGEPGTGGGEGVGSA